MFSLIYFFQENKQVSQLYMEYLIWREDTFLNILHTQIFFSRSEGMQHFLKMKWICKTVQSWQQFLIVLPKDCWECWLHLNWILWFILEAVLFNLVFSFLFTTSVHISTESRSCWALLMIVWYFLQVYYVGSFEICNTNLSLSLCGPEMKKNPNPKLPPLLTSPTTIFKEALQLPYLISTPDGSARQLSHLSPEPWQCPKWLL